MLVIDSGEKVVLDMNVLVLVVLLVVILQGAEDKSELERPDMSGAEKNRAG